MVKHKSFVMKLLLSNGQNPKLSPKELAEDLTLDLELT